MAQVPTLEIDTDVDLAAPFADRPRAGPAFFVCDGFEDEASAAAAQVLVHVERGETPVALIAQDRVLVRRVRALLERDAVVLRDETGWKLATTRAGAAVMAPLLAARRDASADVWLDWLKSAPFAAARSGALEALEAAMRKRQVADAAGAGHARARAGGRGGARRCRRRRRRPGADTEAVARRLARRAGQRASTARRAFAVFATTPPGGRRSPRSASSRPSSPSDAPSSLPTSSRWPWPTSPAGSTTCSSARPTCHPIRSMPTASRCRPTS
jgi:hypothetical protein